MNITRNVLGGLSLWLSLAGLGAQTLKFELVDQYKIVVRGSIGPLQGLKLLIDTGAMPSMVDRRVAKKLALNVEEAEYVAFGTKARVQTTVLPNIRLGARHVDAVPAGVADLSYLHGVDVIVGLDVLSRVSFSIDYVERRLEFGPVLARKPGLRLEATPPFITVQLSISGKPFRFLVDTGSSRLILFENRVRNRLPFLAVHGELVLYHLAGSSRLQRVFLPPLEADGSTIQHVEGFMSDQSLDGYPPGIDGVLGLRALASKHIDLDFERGRLAFD